MNILNNFSKKIKIKQIKSTIGCIKKHKAIMLCLGLKGINSTIVLNDTPSIQGMLKKVKYLIKLEI